MMFPDGGEITFTESLRRAKGVAFIVLTPVAAIGIAVFVAWLALR